MNNLVDIGKIKVMMTLGQAGTSIASIEKTSTSTSTDYYTITLTDGSTTQLSIEKGVGIVSIEKTSTVGLVDTYTITLTNGDTTTFDVINGQSYTVPTDGVLYYEGNTVPEGFEQTTPPAGQAVEIDDSAPSAYKVYSSQKVEDMSIKKFKVKGQIIKGDNDRLVGMGVADVTLINGVAIITFNGTITTTSDVTNNFNYGISASLLHDLDPNIPLITPSTSPSGYWEASCTESNWRGYATALVKAEQSDDYWVFGRYYQTSFADFGKWSAQTFNGMFKGICYGTY